MNNLSERIKLIKEQLLPTTKLIAVSKGISIEKIQTAYTNGLRNFGESRLQEAIEKIKALKNYKDLEWHFIGRLQSNKVKPVVLNFSWIHSVDSLDLLTRINRIASQQGVYPKVCLQVKLAEDPNKGGFLTDNLLNSLKEIDSFNNIEVKGLMTILPQRMIEEERLNSFEQLNNLKNVINGQQFENIKLTELSMGMSSDYLQAIKAGATMVRIGRALFAE